MAPRAGLIQGMVVGFGPVHDGITVTAFAVANGRKDRALGSDTAAAARVCWSAYTQPGAFNIDVGSYNGPLVLEATGGSYRSLATGQDRPMYMTLTAGAESPAGTHVISPLTTAAFDREFLTQAGGPSTNQINADNIRAATAAMASICGCKPADEAPLFVDNMTGSATFTIPNTAIAQGDWIAILSQYVTGSPVRVPSGYRTYPDATGLLTFAFNPDDPSIALAAADWGMNLLNGTYVTNLRQAKNVSAFVTSPDPLTANAAASDAGAVTRSGLTLQINLGAAADHPIKKFTLDQIKEAFFAAYPVMRSRFNPSAPSTVTLTFNFDPATNWVAFTQGNAITINMAWLSAHPLDIDVIVHEGFHVVQSYSSNNGAAWVSEGLADYARYLYGSWNAVSGWTMGRPDANSNYQQGYGPTARFLHWLEERQGPEKKIIESLDSSMRAGQYTAAFWTTQTGKTVDQLWSEYLADSTFERSN